MKNTLLIIFTSCFVIIACKKDNNFRNNEDVYPKPMIYSYKYKVFDDSNMVWIDSVYISYKYKDLCNKHIEVSIPLSDSITEQLRIDSLGIMKAIQSKLKQDGISHFVGQILTQEKLVIHFYANEDVNPLMVFSRIDMPFSVRFQNDEEWGEYNYLLNKNMLRWPKQE